jgi:hypothetical protein
VLIEGLKLEEDGRWTQNVGDDCHGAKFKITSNYHKSGDSQDNTANREFWG